VNPWTLIDTLWVIFWAAFVVLVPGGLVVVVVLRRMRLIWRSAGELAREDLDGPLVSYVRGKGACHACGIVWSSRKTGPRCRVCGQVLQTPIRAAESASGVDSRLRTPPGEK